jgi:hypothetical protein
MTLGSYEEPHRVIFYFRQTLQLTEDELQRLRFVSRWLMAVVICYKKQINLSLAYG